MIDERTKTYFFERVDRGDGAGCWLWLGGLQSTGYGNVNRTHPTRLAHRLSWLIYRGPIPEGMSVLHRCDNPPCVRPAHLFLGTQADNMADKRQKGRAAARSQNGAARLTDDQYQSIVERVAAGERQVDIARDLGVSPQAVCQFLKRYNVGLAS